MVVRGDELQKQSRRACANSSFRNMRGTQTTVSPLSIHCHSKSYCDSTSSVLEWPKTSDHMGMVLLRCVKLKCHQVVRQRSQSIAHVAEPVSNFVTSPMCEYNPAQVACREQRLDAEQNTSSSCESRINPDLLDIDLQDVSHALDSISSFKLEHHRHQCSTDDCANVERGTSADECKLVFCSQPCRCCSTIDCQTSP